MKKKVFITFSALGAIVAILLLLFAFVFLSGNRITIARCIITENGGFYMVYEDRPVHLNYNKDIDYKSGDKLLIVHRAEFAESYPEQTVAKYVIKLEDGSVSDVPQNAIDILTDLQPHSS